MKYVKSKYRNNLSDEHLLVKATLMFGITKFNVNYQNILNYKQFQTFHSGLNKTSLNYKNKKYKTKK
jgi:hypothetical protein